MIPLAIAERTGFDLLAYRTALREMLGYTSHGYIFHPIPFADGRIGIAAIGSGYDGSGDPAVRSKRHEYGMDRLLALPDALGVDSFELDHDGQVGYFVECILGGSHGLAVGGFGRRSRPGEPAGAPRWRGVSAPHCQRERALFMEATSLDDAGYRRAFDAPVRRLVSGHGLTTRGRD